MYTIAVDHGRRIIGAHLSGFFTGDEVSAFARDEQAAAASLVAGAPFALLLTTSGAVAQAQEIVAAFRGLARDLPVKAAQIAIVTDSALLTMQLRRIVDPARTRVFERQEEALTWLEQSLTRAADSSGVAA